jgi:hypothetical protein
MPDYSKGKIYTLRCRNDISIIYVGSTIQPLAVRFGGHKCDSKRYSNHQLYSKIEDWNDWYIELYLNYPCNSKEELHQKEGEVIREIGNLNTIINGRTKKEYRELNREHLNECRREKKDDELKSNREFRKTHNERISCDCGGYYQHCDKSHHFKTKLHLNYLSSQGV